MASIPPGDIVTQPARKIDFNAPFDHKHTYCIDVYDSSERRIGWETKTTNTQRLGVDPPYGVLDPKKSDKEQAKTRNDCITVEWINTPEGAPKQRHHDKEAQPPKVNIEPASLKVPASGGVSTYQLHNESHKRLAFKTRTTDSQHYRISKVYGFIDGGESATIEVKRLVGPPSTDIMLVQLLEVSAEDTDPRVPFKLGLPPVTELLVPMFAN